MTDPNDPLKDGLTPADYDEYGDEPTSGQQQGAPDKASKDEPGDEPNAGESPLG